MGWTVPSDPYNDHYLNKHKQQISHNLSVCVLKLHHNVMNLPNLVFISIVKMEI